MSDITIMVADDDFIEQLHELSFEEMDITEAAIEYVAWEKENVL
jgi:hypothetical protein